MAQCYDDAVQILRSRFGNEALLVEKNMTKMVDLQPLRFTEDVRGLRRRYDELQARIRGLRATKALTSSDGSGTFTVGNGTDLQ